KALALRTAPPTAGLMTIDAMGADVELPLERPMFTLSVKPRLTDLALQTDQAEDDINTARLFDQVVVDKARLRATVQQALRARAQITLRELINDEPLHQGLAELVAYLELAHDGVVVDGGAVSVDGLRAVVDETVEEPIRWMASNPMGEQVMREARLPRVIFTR
ncbi:MAG: DUF3375 family protein, partial [Hydrogenophaga sp.]|nr:DUF3375 family protein [Hydrogenophaga sp.]